MKNRYQDLSQELESGVEQLLAQYEQLREDHASLTVQLNQALTELSETKELMEKYKANYERLQVAKAFGMSPESKKRADERIVQLVRDIEYCLALLKE